MGDLSSALSNTTVQLDERSKQSLRDIHYIIESAGKLTALLSFAHVLSWAEKDISGPIAIMTEDWEGFARAMLGMRAIQLDMIYSIAQQEASRFTLNDGGGQREFWENIAKAASKAMRGQ